MSNKTTLELTGTLKVIGELQTFCSGFTKREFVIETPDDKYPQMVKFETVRDGTDLLNDLTLGDELKITFDVRGNEYKGKYYVNLNAWRINVETPAAKKQEQPADAEPEDDDLGDVPF